MFHEDAFSLVRSFALSLSVLHLILVKISAFHSGMLYKQQASPLSTYLVGFMCGVFLFLIASF